MTRIKGGRRTIALQESFRRGFPRGTGRLPYKNVAAVVDAADFAGLAKKVARVEPLVCIKG
ncbi:MAG TPA: hypothetical protein VNF69_10655 [Burkholderiales bacterium]|nr:hypothetical protein [Burkholderiales bacterium]